MRSMYPLLFYPSLFHLTKLVPLKLFFYKQLKIPAMMESVLHSLPVSTFVNSRMRHFHNI